jgi:hypothetical protein
MSMSSHVVAFRPADAKWHSMVVARASCKSAGVPVPEEIEKFFDYEDPSNKPGIELKIPEAVEKFSEESREGFTVDIEKLPAGVRFIRFFNSY